MAATGIDTCKLSRRGLIGGVVASLMAGPASAIAWADTFDDPYPLPPFVYSKLKPAFRPTVVPYKGRQYVGTVIVDTAAHQIYLILEGVFAGTSRLDHWPAFRR